MATQSNSTKVLKGVSSQTFVTIVLGVVEIVGFSIMSRILSKQDFGYYAAITTITTIFSSFADSGIGSAIIQKKELDKAYINHAFTLNLLFGTFATLLLCLCSGPVSKFVADETMQLPLIFVSVTLLFGCLTSVNLSLMQRKLQFLQIGFINLISQIITIIVAIILALKGFGYYAILAKAVLNSILLMLFSYFAAKTKYSLAFNAGAFNQILNFSGWLMASSFFRQVAEQIDRLMMSRLISIESLGAYTRPKEFITNISSKVCQIFDSTLFPVLSSIQDEKDKIVTSYKYTLYFLNLIASLISLGFIFNSELIIRIFFGEEWLSINVLFKVLSLSFVCYINGRIGDIFMRSLAYTKQQFYFRILQATISIMFILIACREGSSITVAVTYLISYTLIVIVKMLFISRKISFKFKDTINIVLLSFAPVLYYLPLYIISFFITNSLGRDILRLVGFMILTALLFLLCPSMVGKIYKEIAYDKIMVITSKILRVNKT